MTSECLLCQSPVNLVFYKDGEKTFCCAGCQTVHQILAIQQALNNVSEHPLFKQALKSGLIANPRLLEEINSQKIGEKETLEKLHLEIHDMWCPSCAEVIKLTLLKEWGITYCYVDYTTDLATIEYAPVHVTKERILKLISNLGYRPNFLQDPRQQVLSRSLSLRFVVAAFFSMNIMMFAYPIYISFFNEQAEGYAQLFAWLSLIGALPVLTYSAWPIWKRFYTGAKVGLWGMEALVVLGVAAATGLSIYEMWRGSSYVYFDSMTVIIVFVLLGKMIESKAKFSAKDSLVQLTRALPRRGRKKISATKNEFVSLKEIHIGDLLVVLSGEKIVLDGIVEEGEGICNESLMTGEALPVPKNVGMDVLAGTILQQGSLVIKVTATSEQTALFQIVEMVEQDIGHKAQYVRTIDSIVKWFVPFVLCLAIGVLVYCLLFNQQDFDQTSLQSGIIRAVSVLLISCPCAIGIAVPLVESQLLNAFAKLGVIIRNRACLALLGKETILVCDKTGTVTEGKYTVLSGYEKLSLEEKSVLKALVSHSNHPIARSVDQAIIDFEESNIEKIEEIIGRGIRGYQGTTPYYFGSAIFLQQQGISTPLVHLRKNIEVQTTVFFAKQNICLAAIHLGDRIQPEVQTLIQSLKGIKTLLVSGDSSLAVEAVARLCGFQKWFAEYHPLQKRELIEKLKKQGEIVMMIGDGINDAPALAASHVGVAVMSATDISIQVSDILLTTNRLQILQKMYRLAKKGHKIIKQNLFWAFFYNCIGLGLAVYGSLTPLFAAFAMVMSSLLVLINSKRVYLNK